MSKRVRHIPKVQQSRCVLCQGRGQVAEDPLKYRKGQGFYWEGETERALPRLVPCWVCNDEARDEAERSERCPACFGKGQVHKSQFYRLAFTGEIEWSCCGRTEPCQSCPACFRYRTLPATERANCPCCQGLGKVHSASPRKPETLAAPYHYDGPEPVWTCCDGLFNDAAPCRPCPLCDSDGRLAAEKSPSCPVCHNRGAIHRTGEFEWDGALDQYRWACCQESRPCLPCPLQCKSSKSL